MKKIADLKVYCNLKSLAGFNTQYVLEVKDFSLNYHLNFTF